MIENGAPFVVILILQFGDDTVTSTWFSRGRGVKSSLGFIYDLLRYMLDSHKVSDTRSQLKLVL
jgi:hypothetical protein